MFKFILTLTTIASVIVFILFAIFSFITVIKILTTTNENIIKHNKEVLERFYKIIVISLISLWVSSSILIFI